MSKRVTPNQQTALEILNKLSLEPLQYCGSSHLGHRTYQAVDIEDTTMKVQITREGRILWAD